MKKRVINTVAAAVFILSVLVLVLQGFWLPPVSGLAGLILRILAAFSAQTFFILNFKHPVLRSVPLILSMLLALWGGCLFMLSDSWANATMDAYLADYCSPLIGCLVPVHIFQNEN